MRGEGNDYFFWYHKHGKGYTRKRLCIDLALFNEQSAYPTEFQVSTIAGINKKAISHGLGPIQ